MHVYIVVTCLSEVGIN